MSNTQRLPLVNSYIDKWAKEQPHAVAMVQHGDGREITYKKFALIIDFFCPQAAGHGQKGNNVFPGEVEEDITKMEEVDMVEIIGRKHALFDEGIFAFVRPIANSDLTSREVMDYCKSIASYKRPQHVEIWPWDKELPLTRSTKVDKLTLMEMADTIIETLRKEGKWDVSH